MKIKKICFIVLFSFSGLAFGQEALDHSQSIKANFNAKSIKAYQENSQQKLNEFYEYLTLYSHEKDAELRNQILKNIHSIVESESIKMLDFTLPSKSEISLQDFLTLIQNESYQFQILEQPISKELEWKQWTNLYTIQVKKDNQISDYSIQQIILFQPMEKRFGSKTKTVWEIKLGNQSH
ncbi:hypothetical protein [Moheibacter lacus]|uniref:Uncharacterized protein n=1 Tax=Moheibacter lacus TaxID=2745851 RepID=A0A838ZPH0_9FLAO|nr:hypothetical protein [Moheibacter lacus]MBA5629716.1 hypothetical protein [Moheibacter lacus]